MTDSLFGGETHNLDWLRRSSVAGKTNLGIFHDQRFFALRANGDHLRLPFPASPFVALIDITKPIDDAILENYANDIIGHGCVQAICRGEESDRLTRFFDNLADSGELDRDGGVFTAMCLEDEPLEEALEYFSLPCGLGNTKLLLVIGDDGEFHEVIDTFSTLVTFSRESPAPEISEDAEAFRFQP